MAGNDTETRLPINVAALLISAIEARRIGIFRWGMARGVYLIGSKLAERVRAVQIVDCAGNSTTLRLKDYISRKIQPEYKVLPWQDDVALASANKNSKFK